MGFDGPATKGQATAAEGGGERAPPLPETRAKPDARGEGVAGEEEEEDHADDDLERGVKLRAGGSLLLLLRRWVIFISDLEASSNLFEHLRISALGCRKNSELKSRADIAGVRKRPPARFQTPGKKTDPRES